MISYLKEPYKISDIDNILTSEIKKWFYSKFKEYTPPQRYSIVNIHNKMNTLICSPTGSGKTLSAFMSIINELVNLDLKNELEDKVYAIYISPLKALGNDIEKNLNEPLSEIIKIYEESGKKLNIRVAKRTGDTTNYEKSKMTKNPPHILITTPETFDIILTSKNFRKNIREIKWLIVDEIHSIAESKRGSDLSVAMERLNLLIPSYTRIGISATISPLSDVARYLVGYEYNDEKTRIERNCDIVDLSVDKKIDIKVRTPVDSLSKYRPEYINKKMYELLHQQIKEHKTTLIFTNTRARTEKLVNELKNIYNKYYEIFKPENNVTDNKNLIENDIDYLEYELEKNKNKKNKNDDKNTIEMVYDYTNATNVINEINTKNDIINNVTNDKTNKITNAIISQEIENNDKNEKKHLIGAHHGSLSKYMRIQVEEKLKSGEMKCVVSSTSLELGIDIGSIDLVILLGSPKSVSRLIQRIGRSGHSILKTSKALMIAQNRDELVECSILAKCLQEKKIDKIRIPNSPLDVLSQQIIGISCDEFLREDQIYDVLRKSFSFRDLKYEDFHETILYLSGKYKPLENRYIFPKIKIDENLYIVSRNNATRMIYLSNLGTISDEANVKIKKGDEYIGSLDESFTERLKKGDVFVLGGNNYEYVVKRNMTIKVKEANHKLPTVPSWYSEMLPLSFEIGLEIGKFNKWINDLLKNYYEKFDKENYKINLSSQDYNVIKEEIKKYIFCDDNTATNIVSYYKEQYLFSTIPTYKKLLIEEYQEELGSKVHYIFFTYYGRRVNDAFSRLLAYYIGKSLNKDIEVSINDMNFYIALDEKININRYIELLFKEDLDILLNESLEKTDIFKKRFRDCATRSFLILKRYKDYERSVAKQEISSTILLKLVKEIDENFFIIRETKREIKYDLMDLDNLKIIFRAIKEKKIIIQKEEVMIPSPFSLNILSQGYSDVLKIQDRDEFLLNMRALILAKISKGKFLDNDIKNEIEYINYKIKDNQENKKDIDEIENVELKEIRYKEQLIRQLKTGVYKDDIPENVYFDLQNKIMDNDYLLSQESINFLKNHFSGVVNDYWKDEIVKFIYNVINFRNSW
ncbi:MAG: DEAD/DEAH box helicase [Candidatus Nanoarchaeia archaeon]|nr:DEAD/DEAH box helicase [Candidatus Nanoarchaeia archaeon]